MSIARPLIANNDLVRDLPQRQGSRGQALHLLQPVPRQRRGEPARVLRRDALSLARGDDRRRSCRCSIRRRSSRSTRPCDGGNGRPGGGDRSPRTRRRSPSQFIAFLMEASARRDGSGPRRRFNQARATACVGRRVHRTRRPPTGAPGGAVCRAADLRGDRSDLRMPRRPTTASATSAACRCGSMP